MKINTLLTLEDNRRANFYFTYSRPIMIVFCVLALFFAVALLFLYATGYVMDKVNLYIMVFYIVYVSCVIPLMVYVRTRKYYESNKNLHKPITYEFTDNGIELSGEDISSRYLWENVYQVRESKNMFYIYQSKAIANLLPKRYFSAEEIVEFRDLVKRKGIKSKLRKNS